MTLLKGGSLSVQSVRFSLQVWLFFILFLSNQISLALTSCNINVIHALMIIIQYYKCSAF